MKVIFDDRIDEHTVDNLTDELVRYVEEFLSDEYNIILGSESYSILEPQFREVMIKFFGLHKRDN